MLLLSTIRVLNSLDPDQGRRSVSSDLGPNYLYRLSVASKQGVKLTMLNMYYPVFKNSIDPDQLIRNRTIFHNGFNWNPVN